MIRMSDVQQPAGWYTDPAGDATKLRYWDGNNWTDQLMDAVISQAAVPTTTPYQPTITTPSYSADQNQPYGQQPYGQQPYGQQPYQNQYAQPIPAPKDTSGLATAALVLGIIGLLGAWLLALIGYVLGILAIVFGVKGRSSSKAKLATAGIVLGAVTLLFACVNSILGVILMSGGF
jgi:hypothetical protein